MQESTMRKLDRKKLVVFSDFDRTLTYGTQDGKQVSSLISLLRDGNHLTKEYAPAAQALFDRYHPIEMDASLTVAQKSLAMEEWWRTHYQLLVDSGLRKEDLRDIATSGHLRLRDGVKEFLQLLATHRVPLVIVSASGLGDALPLYLESQGVLADNVHIVANMLIWGEHGAAIGVQEPIIHPFNKEQIALEQMQDVQDALRGKTSCLVLGDSLGDANLAQRFTQFTVVTKVGFFNPGYDTDLSLFRQLYDVVIENDGDFWSVIDLISPAESL